MALNADLTSEVRKIFRGNWTIREGQVVPEPGDLKLGNDAVTLNAAVLYADMSGSTKLVDGETPAFAAEVYKCYLLCAARLVKQEGGVITAYDGDRIMAVFIGGSKNTTAVRTAMKINYAVRSIINPELADFYKHKTFRLAQTVGVDTSEILVARIGVRNDNDLVWVGRAANYAAKLSDINNGSYRTFITGDVYDQISDDAKFGGQPRTNMWEERRWTPMNNLRIYRSSWCWPF